MNKFIMTNLYSYNKLGMDIFALITMQLDYFLGK